MSDDNVAADPYDGKSKEDLQEELRALGKPVSGNKDELWDRLHEDDETEGVVVNDGGPDDHLTGDLDERASEVDESGVDGSEGGGDTEAVGPSHLPEQADKSPLANTRLGLVEEHLGPDGKPLPQLHPEPADVAGPASGEGTADEFSTRALAHAARDRADAAYREGDGSKEHMSMRDVDASPTNSEFDPAHYPEEGFHESTLPVTDRREAQLAEWADSNPHANVIPPTLLPPAYQDPTIATPGLPGEAVS